VDNLDAAVGGRKQGNLVGNGLGIGEGRGVLANLREAQNNVLAIGTTELGLGLLSKNHEVGIGVLPQQSASSLAETRVDTTTETLVGAGNNEERLLVLLRLGLGGLEDGVGSSSVDTRLLHGLLGAGQTGGGDDLHGVGDFLDVADRLETTLDFTEGSEIGGIGRSSAATCQQLSLCLHGIMFRVQPERDSPVPPTARVLVAVPRGGNRPPEEKHLPSDGGAASLQGRAD
jgi:hypothetical protein